MSNQVIRAWILLVAVACALDPGTAAGTDGTPVWLEVEVAPPAPGAQLSAPTLAFDHYGRPSVSWSRVFATGLNEAYRSDRLGLGLWSHHLLEGATNTGMATSVSFDRAERPFSIWQGGSGSIKYQFNNGSTQTLVASGAHTTRPLLHAAHDLAGVLRGVYAGNNPGQVFAIQQSGTSYTSTNLFTIANVSEMKDLRLTTDHMGLRHIAARVETTTGDEKLFLASEPLTGGPWASMLHPAAGNVRGIDITTSPEGEVAFAYSTFESGTNTSRVFYSKFNGISLETTQVLSTTAHQFHDLSLAFDMSDGRPAIAYERQTVTPTPAEELHYAWLNASSVWQSVIVDGTISLSNPSGRLRRPSLAFDDFGTSWPAIAYADSDGSMNVAFDPPVPEPATLLLMACGLMVAARRRRRT